MKNKIIVILGPTGCGKTELAVRLAKKFNGEIIGVDSRQIYRGMAIGTAAPCTVRFRESRWIPVVRFRLPTGDETEQTKSNRAASVPCLYKGVRHYLVGFLEPDEIFSVAEFKKMAMEIIGDILKRGKVPFLVGGTAHYLQAIADGLAIPPVPPDWKLRKKLEKKSLKILIRQLGKLDPPSLKIVDLKNKRRVIRALEVCRAGYRFSEVRKREESFRVNPRGYPRKSASTFEFLQLGIDVPRKELYKRIDKRVKEMIKGGLIRETKKLISFFGYRLSSVAARFGNRQPSVVKDFTTNDKRTTKRAASFDKRLTNIPALSGIGYKEIIGYLDKKITLEKAEELIAFRTHKYVRHQMNWFNRNKKIKWVKSYKKAEGIVRKFLSEYNLLTK